MIWNFYLATTRSIAYATIYIIKKCNIIFQKWGGGVKGRLEFFQKFIRFGSGTLPQVISHITNLICNHWRTCIHTHEVACLYFAMSSRTRVSWRVALVQTKRACVISAPKLDRSVDNGGPSCHESSSSSHHSDVPRVEYALLPPSASNRELD